MLRMAATQFVQKLPQQLKQFVLTASGGSEAFGKTPLEEAQVSEWVGKVAGGDIAKSDALLVSSNVDCADNS